MVPIRGRRSATAEFSESITGRVAVVVGAGGGIGGAIAARLGSAGCRLALLDLDKASLDRAAKELGLADPVLVIACDITDRRQVDEAASAVRERLGAVDILVNSAGTNTKQRTLAGMSPDQWEQVIAVNLSGVFHCVQAFLPLMQERGGCIVTIASTTALAASPLGGAHYCAAKRALLSLSESVNAEQGRYGIRACAILPGEVDTPLIDKRPSAPSAERRAAMLKAGDVAEAVHFVVTRPARVTISDLVIWPSAQIAGTYAV